MVVALLMQLVMLHRGNYHKVLQFCLTTTHRDKKPKKMLNAIIPNSCFFIQYNSKKSTHRLSGLITDKTTSNKLMHKKYKSILSLFQNAAFTFFIKKSPLFVKDIHNLCCYLKVALRALRDTGLSPSISWWEYPLPKGNRFSCFFINSLPYLPKSYQYLPLYVMQTKR